MTNRILIPLHDKVIGKTIEDFGFKTTSGGLIINDKDGDEKSIRPRWFQVTHVGPKNKDILVDEFVLVAHGRWSRGFNLNEGEPKLFHLDTDEILLKSDTAPV